LTSQIEEAQADLEKIDITLKQYPDEIKSVDAQIEQTRKEMKPEHDRYFQSVEEDTDHIYLVLRAISLGAIGAFASFMAQIASAKSLAPPKRPRIRYSVIFAAILVGAIVAIAVVGLFFTKQITIFEPGEAAAVKVPEFWRVTIVCLIAGAFADRIFAATTNRVDKYLGEEIAGRPAERLIPTTGQGNRNQI
jgi:hypothetical protein